MKRITRNIIMALVIIACVVFITIFIVTKIPVKSDVQTSRCIGQNSFLYSRLGCHFCEIQQDIFGDNYQYLTVIDCFYNESQCADIPGTPTWIIGGKQYVGVQAFAKLKDLTGC
jgi:hypothetical protein